MGVIKQAEAATLRRQLAEIALAEATTGTREPLHVSDRDRLMTEVEAAREGERVAWESVQ